MDDFLGILEPRDLYRLVLVHRDFGFLRLVLEDSMPEFLRSGGQWYRLCTAYVRIQLDNGHFVQPTVRNVIALTAHRCAICFHDYERGALNSLGVIVHARCLYPLVEDVRSGDSVGSAVIELWKDDEKIRRTVWPVHNSHGILQDKFLHK
jgi:hypothetical protein